MPETTDPSYDPPPYASSNAATTETMVPPPPPIMSPQNPWASGGAAAGQQQMWSSERYVYPIHKMAPGRGPGKTQVSDFRSGEVVLSPEGLYVSGKAVLPAATRSAIIAGGILIGIGVLLIALIVEYAIRQARTDSVPWSAVENIILEPEKNRVCIVYRDPTKPKLLPQSLAFRLEPTLYQDFEATARRFAPDRTAPGKILPPTPVWVYFIIIAIPLLLIALIILTSRH